MQIPSASGAFFKVRNRHDNMARLRKRRKNLLQSPAVGARGRFLRTQFNGKQGGDHRFYRCDPCLRCPRNGQRMECSCAPPLPSIATGAMHWEGRPKDDSLSPDTGQQWCACLVQACIALVGG